MSIWCIKKDANKIKIHHRRDGLTKGTGAGPSRLEIVFVVSLHVARIRRDVIPLDQNEISLQRGGEAVLHLEVPAGRFDVRTDGVVGIGGRSHAGDEGEGMRVEAGLGSNFAGCDGTGLEFEVSCLSF